MTELYNGKLLLSAREAAAALSICEKSLWNYSQPRGPIPSVKIGTRILYSPGDLQSWINEQKAESLEGKYANTS